MAELDSVQVAQQLVIEQGETVADAEVILQE